MTDQRTVNVVCLKWGTKYGPEYVNRLYRGIMRHINLRTDQSLRFWCFTDDPRGILPEVQIHELPYSSSLDIWWNKLWLFSSEMPIPNGETVFYVDLDTLITRDINDLVFDRTDKIVVLRDFYHGLARTAGDMGSGLMRWQHPNYDAIWSEFWKDPQRHVREIQPLGDQKWIELQTPGQRLYWQDLYPQRVVSFKVHCRWGLPDQASIICYHGAPSIPESASQHTRDWKWRITPQPWVWTHWRD